MADFQYIQDFVFDPSGVQVNNSIFASSLADEDGDNQFETGDQTFSTNDYVGTITVDGIVMPVFQRPDGAHHVYNPGPGYVTPPATFPGATPGVFEFCFAAGTRISTPHGDAAVETLSPGDPILTAAGGTVAVKWVGRLTTFPHLGAPKPPVRIRAGALGSGQPHSDLTVTADHGMVLDGHVITAAALVNGGSIDWVPMAELPERFTVYHVETEAHDAILANGAPAETFIDAAGRAAFDNHAEYLDLNGADRIVPEMPLPRITSARMIPETIAIRLGISRQSFLQMTA